MNKIDSIKKLCLNVIKDLGLEDDTVVDVEKDDFNKSTRYTLFSTNLCNYLSQINYKQTIWKDDLISSFIRLIKPTFGTLPVAYLQRIEFLMGSYLNDGTDNEGEWKFCNNMKKVNMILDFMHVLASEGDSITTRSLFRTPNIHTIQLNTDSKLWQILKKESNNYSKW